MKSYSVVAMWRLNATLDMSSAKRWLWFGIGLLACAYCAGVVIGQISELVSNATVVLLMITTFCALVGRSRSAPMATGAARRNS